MMLERVSFVAGAVSANPAGAKSSAEKPLFRGSFCFQSSFFRSRFFPGSFCTTEAVSLQNLRRRKVAPLKEIIDQTGSSQNKSFRIFTQR